MTNQHWMKIQTDLGVKSDGIAGPITQARLNYQASIGNVQIVKPVFINPPASAAPNVTRDAELVSVHPDLVGVLEEAMRRSNQLWDVIEGKRSAERQKQLVAAGASKTQNSLHLIQPTGYAHAADVWPIGADGQRMPAGSPDKEAALWARLRAFAVVVKAVAKDRGIQVEWGGDWGWDAPHFQLNRAAYAR